MVSAALVMEEAKETLKRLLEAEARAQAFVEQASRERDQIIQQALAEVRRAEARFAKRIPELQQSFVDQAESRAEQAISALTRRYGERREQLEALAQERLEEAREAALANLLDPFAYP
jgi:V/A-type H+/Na+-transporting ATPase subunit G/H